MLPFIELDDGSILDDQLDIKNEVKNFYKELYRKRDVEDCNFDNLNNVNKKISDDDKKESDKKEKDKVLSGKDQMS